MQSPSLVDRVRAEFMEMPGLQLTVAQAARLWGLDMASCHKVVDLLIEAAFLRRTQNGKIIRSSA